MMMDTCREVALSGVDGRPVKVDAPVPVLKMDRWKTVTVASQSAPDRCVPQTRQEAWLGPPALDGRFWCEVCLVFGSSFRQPFIKWLGVATDVAMMVASDLQMYYFIRSL